MSRGVSRVITSSLVAGVFFIGMVTAHGQEASVPRVIQFSGVLNDSAGQPLTGVQGVSFALYREQQGGAPLWIETQNVAADEYGRFAALLGATTSGGVPVELFSSGESRWLGVQPIQSRDSDGAVLPEQPRVLLVSVPYALKAADAETVGGLPPSAFVLAADLVTERVKESGGLTVAAIRDGLITAAAAGDTGYHLKFTDDVGGTGRAALFEDGSGRIGLGTTAPAELFHIVSPTTARLRFDAQGTAQFTNATFLLRLSEVVDAHKEWWFFASKDSGGAATGTSSFQIRRRNASQSEALTPFVITGAGHVALQAGFTAGAQTLGNVGIGTQTPSEKLHIVTPGNARMKLEAQSTVQFTNADLVFRLKEATDAHTEWHFFASKDAAGAATGTSSFQIRRRNAGQDRGSHAVPDHRHGRRGAAVRVHGRKPDARQCRHRHQFANREAPRQRHGEGHGV